MTQTDHLALSGIGVPPYSVRGVTQTLEPIVQASQVRRTINGTLVDRASPRFRKFASTVTGADQQPPAFDDSWPGRLVTVDCAVLLAVEGTITEPTEGNGLLFDRPHVPGSVIHESGFTFYRPRLEMRVIGWTINRDPWGAVIDWSLMLEEV